MNNTDSFKRTKALLGEEKMNLLNSAHICVFGIGGVGGYVCESLVRSGIGHFTLVDADTVNETNINRQIIALNSTVGRYKAEVMKERMLDINPEVSVEVRNVFYSEDNDGEFDLSSYDYVVDCIDSVNSKVHLIKKAKEAGVPIISSMGAGNKMDPSKFRVSDIYKTSVDPLAKTMRHRLKAEGIKNLKCVYSEEVPGTSLDPKVKVASTAFAPPGAGLLIASEVIRDLIK